MRYISIKLIQRFETMLLLVVWRGDMKEIVNKIKTQMLISQQRNRWKCREKSWKTFVLLVSRILMAPFLLLIPVLDITNGSTVETRFTPQITTLFFTIERHDSRSTCINSKTVLHKCTDCHLAATVRLSLSAMSPATIRLTFKNAIYYLRLLSHFQRSWPI